MASVKKSMLNEVDRRETLLQFLLAIVSCRGETQCGGNVRNVSSTCVAEFDFLTENLDSGMFNLCLFTLIFI